jgi:phospholipid/cholesterol/gamma-HCH transport system substrate-binding protein
MNTRYITLGTFVLVTLGAFAWLAAQLGFSPRDGNRYTVRMNDAQGLVEGNAVRIAGVEIGKIDDIHVEGNQAVVHINIKKGNVLLTDVCAASLMKGMLGEKFLGLTQSATGAPLAPGGEIACVKDTVDVGTALNSTASMVYGDTELLAPVARLVTRLDTLTAELDAKDIPRDKLNKLLDDTSAVMATTRAMLEENREDVRAIVSTGRKLLQSPKIPRMLDNAEDLVDTLHDKVPGMLETSERALNKLDKAAGTLDDERIAKIGKMLDDGSIAVKNLRAISEDFKAQSKDIAKEIAPLLKNLGVIAKRATHITEGAIRQMLQVEGFRVRIGQSREAREYMKNNQAAGADD